MASEKKIQQLQQHAVACAERFEHDNALKFYEKILELQPDNCDVMDACAELCVDAAKPELALTLFTRSMALKPEENPTKYLNAAQLQTGHSALGCFQKGVQLLERELQQRPEAEAEIRARLSAALCSIAELYMTDLCDEETAETECERYMTAAQTHNPQDPQMCVQFANLRLCQQRPEDAKNIVYKAVRIINALEPDDKPVLDCQVQIGKLLLELGQYDEAVEWLKGILELDDEWIETWYLLGFGHHLQSDVANAQHCIAQALRLVRKSAMEGDDEDEELVAQVQALSEELGGVQPAEGPPEPDYSDDEGEDMVES